MKKNLCIILLLFLIFTCTGCSDIRYSLTINKNGINERITLKDKPENMDNLPDGYMSDMSTFEVLFQTLPYNSGSDSAGNYYAEKEFESFNNYVDNSFVYTKYINSDAIKINGEKVNIDISKSNFKSIYNIDAVNISIYIPYYVSSHNATNVNGNIYTWQIDNIDNAHIQINFDMGKNKNFKQTLFSICTIIVFLAIIVAIIIYFVCKSKKNNEI